MKKTITLGAALALFASPAIFSAAQASGSSGGGGSGGGSVNSGGVNGGNARTSVPGVATTPITAFDLQSAAFKATLTTIPKTVSVPTFTAPAVPDVSGKSISSTTTTIKTSRSDDTLVEIGSGRNTSSGSSGSTGSSGGGTDDTTTLAASTAGNGNIATAAATGATAMNAGKSGFSPEGLPYCD
jgi:hypothetical protein